MAGSKTSRPAAATDPVARRVRALSEPVHQRLLGVMRRGERSVTELVEEAGTGPANISKHRGVLLDAGLVARRNEGVSVRYRVADGSGFAPCDTVCASLSERLSAQQTAVAAFAERRDAE